MRAFGPQGAGNDTRDAMTAPMDDQLLMMGGVAHELGAKIWDKVVLLHQGDQR